jgi:hypothetical protein
MASSDPTTAATTRDDQLLVDVTARTVAVSAPRCSETLQSTSVLGAWVEVPDGGSASV